LNATSFEVSCPRAKTSLKISLNYKESVSLDIVNLIVHLLAVLFLGVLIYVWARLNNEFKSLNATVSAMSSNETRVVTAAEFCRFMELLWPHMENTADFGGLIRFRPSDWLKIAQDGVIGAKSCHLAEGKGCGEVSFQSVGVFCQDTRVYFDQNYKNISQSLSPAIECSLVTTDN
jgi:hypothetical protein